MTFQLKKQSNVVCQKCHHILTKSEELSFKFQSEKERKCPKCSSKKLAGASF